MPPTNLNPSLYQAIGGSMRQLVEDFILDRKARGLSPSTIRAYSQELGYFLDWCDRREISDLSDVTAGVIREYLLDLSKTRNPGGCNIGYRTIKTFTFWWEQENDGEYTSPIRKIKPPKITVTPLPPVELPDIKSMLDTCEHTLLGLRDKAIMLCLLDTGMRANEFVSVLLSDTDLVSGAIIVRHGKGGKTRTVFLGHKSRRAVRAYLRNRQDDCPALWVTDDGRQLAFDGLKQLIKRRAKKAGIKQPPLHSFRRAFAINMLRAGVDVFSLQKLMGHADLQVLRRYLAQTTEDIAAAHQIGSPVDNNKF